ncbi:hypothetical protein NGB36_32400 [Streptomyces sp. RB6PN25]|uniref:DUF8083 domain-containing protein n=1 Tax=Streptomyces humicola TaxID=2953240 RepID=A0ABT1Q5D9_9ACTN|nr:hypothetical protein [Streptomyces humicola]MCQ4085139.1 hypothetical protein [Streptomyces humicola]
MGLATVAVPYATYLRVYEPLAAFPEPERTYWKQYVASGAERTAQDELRQSLADLVPVPPVPVPVHESREAFVAVVDDVAHICPWRTRLRAWLALDELTGQLPAPLLDAVLPPVVRAAAAADYERWRMANPDALPWIRSATWHVPVRWFALFDDAERTFEPSGVTEDTSGAGEKQPTAPVMRYRTAMVEARRRVARGLRVLRDTLEEGPLIDGLVDLGRWLEEFHPRSLVELDYGGLVYAIPEARLAADHSAALVAEGLAALRGGDSTRASEAYTRLTDHWRGIRELQYAS